MFLDTPRGDGSCIASIGHGEHRLIFILRRLAPTLLGLALALCGSAAAYRPIVDALLRSDGFALVIENPNKVFRVAPNMPTLVSLRVRNLLPRPVRIEGATTPCSCYVPRNLPLTIQAFAVETLRFEASSLRAPLGSTVSRTAQLLLDTPSADVTAGVRLLVTNNP